MIPKIAMEVYEQKSNSTYISVGEKGIPESVIVRISDSMEVRQTKARNTWRSLSEESKRKGGKLWWVKSRVLDAEEEEEGDMRLR